MIGTLTELLSRHQNAVQLSERLQKMRKDETYSLVDLRTTGERIRDAKMRVRKAWNQTKMREDLAKCANEMS